MRQQRRSIVMQVLGLALATAQAGSASIARAQVNPLAPYASIATKEVNYYGPGRDAAYDLTDVMIPIGLVVPLYGPRQAEGEAIIAAAQLALADAAAQGPLPAGRRLTLVLGDESGPSWSATAAALTQLVLDKRAIAVITSANGATAHLSEQVGNRIGVAILTLASDKTTTQIDLPWIFRLGPTDAQEARTIAEDVYRRQSLHRVLLITENDHDGRRGFAEFRDAARELGAPPAASLVLDVARSDAVSVVDAVRANSSQAIVSWTRACTARTLIHALNGEGIAIPLYVTQEAAQEVSGLDLTPQGDGAVQKSGRVEVWSIAPQAQPSPMKGDFARRFREARGVAPSPVAAEAYDAVLLIAQAVRNAGPNRARVRDRIAAARNWPGMSGEISFDKEGNNLAGVRLERLR
ncbi:MAG TPA: ABC transporter substrate-binding protein [Terriglobia bacterium]|nr:ABC transporter substrate-binding protein [Terriglobia bacterium]